MARCYIVIFCEGGKRGPHLGWVGANVIKLPMGLDFVGPLVD